MRKVGSSKTSSDARLESRVGMFAAELDRYTAEFHATLQSNGVGSALQKNSAERVAQYEEVVRVLSSYGEGQEDYGRCVVDLVPEVVEALRNPSCPRWRALALADVLDTLMGCAMSED